MSFRITTIISRSSMPLDSTKIKGIDVSDFILNSAAMSDFASIKANFPSTARFHVFAVDFERVLFLLRCSFCLGVIKIIAIFV